MNAIQIRSSWLDLDGRSLLASAVDSCYTSVLIALLNRGLDPNSGLKETPLHVAASYGDSHAIITLLSFQKSHVGFSVNPLLRDLFGFTPRERCQKNTIDELIGAYEEGAIEIWLILLLFLTVVKILFYHNLL